MLRTNRSRCIKTQYTLYRTSETYNRPIILPFPRHAVKFLREVTPYFRKASIISEVGWELQRAFLCPLGPGANISPPAPRSPPRADTRYIPLLLTHLARNLKHNDPGTNFGRGTLGATVCSNQRGIKTRARAIVTECAVVRVRDGYVLGM